MSLINDALKRAQHDKASKPAASPPFLPAVSDSCATGPGALGPVAHNESPVTEHYLSLSAASAEVAISIPSAGDDVADGGEVPVGVWTIGRPESLEVGARGRVFAVAAAALVVLVCGLAWMWSRSDRPGHVSASVAPQSQPEPELLSSSVLPGATELVSQAISSQLNDASSPKGTAPAGKVADDGLVGMHLVGVVPSSPPAMVSGDATGLAVQALGSASGQSAGGSAKSSTAPSVPSPEPTIRPTAAPASSTSQPDANSTSVSPRAEAGKFTLGGILRIGGEAMATINGKLVRVGDMVDGGRVVTIESQSVELESAGQRVSLRL
jgi:hypothetical protein